MYVGKWRYVEIDLSFLISLRLCLFDDLGFGLMGLYNINNIYMRR